MLRMKTFTAARTNAINNQVLAAYLESIVSFPQHMQKLGWLQW